MRTLRSVPPPRGARWGRGESIGGGAATARLLDDSNETSDVFFWLEFFFFHFFFNFYFVIKNLEVYTYMLCTMRTSRMRSTRMIRLWHRCTCTSRFSALKRERGEQGFSLSRLSFFVLLLSAVQVRGCGYAGNHGVVHGKHRRV